MCGILGGFSNVHQKADVEHALSLMKHRGPYNSGVWFDRGVAVAMNQLPMLQSGEPSELPVRHHNQIVTFNGQLYRDDASSLAQEVSVLSDFLTRGEVPDGMLAAGIWQTDAKQFTLVRDAFGIKPLYYYFDKSEQAFWFSSELKPLLSLIATPAVNSHALMQFIVTGHMLDEQTPWENVQLLPPGSVLTIDRASLDISITTATNLPFSDLTVSNTISEHELSDELESLLREQVNRYQRSFRDIALLKSGGMDSGLIDLMADKALPVFHLKSPETGDDGLDNTTITSDLYQDELKESDFWPLLERAVNSMGMPTRMSSVVMYQQLAEMLASQSFHGVLLGEGADELFCGYPRHEAWSAQDELSVSDITRAYFGDWEKKLTLLPESYRASVNEQIQHYIQCLSHTYHDNLEGLIQWLDRRFSLEPLLRRADHLLMSQTVEGRLPYLSHAMVNITQRMSKRCVVDGKGKYPLRQLAEKSGLFSRHYQKSHFRAPFQQWPDVCNQLKSFVQQLCRSSKVPVLSECDENQLATLGSAELFSLATVGIWYQQVKGLLDE